MELARVQVAPEFRSGVEGSDPDRGAGLSRGDH